LGTIAGDDTIFIAPRKGVSAAKLKRILDSAFGVDSPVAVIKVGRRRP
jgi:hypothetical protein